MRASNVHTKDMANRIANGTEIGFDFCLERVSLRDPIERRTGRGIVVDGQIYSVWPCPGYAVRVTESPNYKAGEVVAITSLSVRP